MTSPQPFPLRPSPYVRDVQTQDGATLLDIHQGICFDMNPLAAQIWQLLKQEHSLGEIADSIAANFADVPKTHIEYDLNDFVSSLKKQGLLLAANPIPPRRVLAKRLLAACQRAKDRWQYKTPTTIPRLLMFRALLGLITFDLFRLGYNFSAIYDVVRTWKVAPIITPTGTVELVCAAVNLACVWYPKRVLCLQRSTITTCLLRSCGVKAEMVIGAQKAPFKAHAWTEVEGTPINERRNVERAFLVWERC